MGVLNSAYGVSIAVPLVNNCRSTATTALTTDSVRQLLSPDDTVYLITSITLTEYSGSGTTVTLHKTPSGSTTADDTCVIGDLVTLAAQEVMQWDFPMGFSLYDGEALYAKAANNSRATITINYLKDA